MALRLPARAGPAALLRGARSGGPARQAADRPIGVAFAVALTWGFFVLIVILAPPLTLTDPQLLGVLVALLPPGALASKWSMSAPGHSLSFHLGAEALQS